MILSARYANTAQKTLSLFPVDWSLVWEKEIVYKANLLTACTVLRIGESEVCRKFIREDEEKDRRTCE